jgi:hypothetical protein
MEVAAVRSASSVTPRKILGDSEIIPCKAKPANRVDSMAKFSVAMMADVQDPATVGTPQKILPSSGKMPRSVKHACDNDEVIMDKIQPMIGSLGIGDPGFSVSRSDMGNGMSSNSENCDYIFVGNNDLSANSNLHSRPKGSVFSDTRGVMHPTLAL